MTVKIERDCITLFGQSLTYDPYWIDILAELDHISSAAFLARLVQQWADALEHSVEGSPIYLPYNLLDDWTECLDARVNAEWIVMKCVHVRERGYEVNLHNLRKFITHRHKIRKEYPESFGVFRKSELVAALRNAEIDLSET